MNKIYRKISEEYEKIRFENERKHDKIISTLYSNLPRLKEIEQELNLLGLNVCNIVLQKNEDAETAVSNLRIQSDKLVNERNEILKKNKLPPDILEDIYTCKLCKDKGIIDTKRCSCYFEKLRKYLLKSSNLADNNTNSFSKFNLNYYSKEKNEKFKISAYENASNILKKSQNFDKGFLFFSGGTGLGKTFTSDCIAKKWIENHKSVYYVTASKLFTTFENYKFNKENSEENKYIIDCVNNSDLLIIDDLGTEFQTAYTDSILFDVLNSRLNENKSMLINSNYTISQIKDVYSERISSRIVGNFDYVYFFGDDIRNTIKNNR